MNALFNESDMCNATVKLEHYKMKAMPSETFVLLLREDTKDLSLITSGFSFDSLPSPEGGCLPQWRVVIS